MLIKLGAEQITSGLFHFDPDMEQSRGDRARAARKPWSTKSVSNHQNGTVIALRLQQQAKLAATSSKRPPPRGKNADRWPREFLTPDEVERLIATTRQRGRRGQ